MTGPPRGRSFDLSDLACSQGFGLRHGPAPFSGCDGPKRLVIAIGTGCLINGLHIGKRCVRFFCPFATDIEKRAFFVAISA
jgi:hypothetical protein